MKTANSFKPVLSLFIATLIFIFTNASAQDYVSGAKPQPGKAPGVKVKQISKSGASTTYMIVFAPGDEIMSGLTDFAVKYQVKSAHFTAIGDVTSAKIGWFDPVKKLFKVNPINEQSEITSMVGDIALFNGTPVVHAHINVAAQNGSVRGGHLLEGFISPTLEVTMTVEPVPLYKKVDAATGLVLMAPEL
jgi:predicted DNA-binding protein with PD1-like motif